MSTRLSLSASRRRSGLPVGAVFLPLVVSLFACGPEPDPVIPDPVYAPFEVEAAEIQAHLEALQTLMVDNGGHRLLGSPGYAATVDYVKERLAQTDLVVTVLEFESRDPWWNLQTTWSILAELPGEQAETWGVSAHLDSGYEGPGMNDNGSGAAAVLALAEALDRSDFRPPLTLRFLLLGAEEVNQTGARMYMLGQSEADRELGIINLDMVGNPLGLDRVAMEPPPGTTFPAASRRMGEALIDGYLVQGRVPYRGFHTPGYATDSEAFLGRGLASLNLDDGGGPIDDCLHAACDDLENVSVDRITAAARATAYALQVLTEGPPDLEPVELDPSWVASARPGACVGHREGLEMAPFEHWSVTRLSLGDQEQVVDAIRYTLTHQQVGEFACNALRPHTVEVLVSSDATPPAGPLGGERHAVQLEDLEPGYHPVTLELDPPVTIGAGQFLWVAVQAPPAPTDPADGEGRLCLVDCTTEQPASWASPDLGVTPWTPLETPYLARNLHIEAHLQP